MSVNEYAAVVDYIYLLHFFESYVTGRYYETMMCVSGTNQCADTISVFGVTGTNTEYHTQADGYLGLGIAHAFGSSSRSSVLEQLEGSGQISEQMFGIYTQADEYSYAESELRFGGYNSSLF